LRIYPEMLTDLGSVDIPKMALNRIEKEFKSGWKMSKSSSPGRTAIVTGRIYDPFKFQETRPPTLVTVTSVVWPETRGSLALLYSTYVVKIGTYAG
jgi:hypothetical protein